MYKYLIFLGFSFLIGLREEEEKAWSTVTPLTWADFKGKVDTNSSFAAAIDTRISYNYDLNSDTIEFEIVALFNPNKSWVKKEDITNRALMHEQLHFDITELFARKIRKVLSQSKFYSKKAIQNELEIYYFQSTSNHLVYQRDYDTETDHGIKTSAQIKWSNKIKKGLDSLSKYSSRIVQKVISK